MEARHQHAYRRDAKRGYEAKRPRFRSPGTSSPGGEIPVVRHLPGEKQNPHDRNGRSDDADTKADKAPMIWSSPDSHPDPDDEDHQPK
jgi:hypothetical protein